jgi:coproporphyrinogen III oxidase-like Fe-S oxidoreductase
MNGHNPLLSLLADAPPSVHTDAILAQWEAARTWFEFGQHSLPKPVWAQREFEHTGAQAWQHLSRQIQSKKDDEAISIYIHVPFCERRCGFCDLYSIPLPKRRRYMEDVFARALRNEMSAWSLLKPLNARPVTTVHLGGGTPNFLRISTLSSIIEECRVRFGTTSKTEWALESTSRLLTDKHLCQLRELGFTRLHVGVQTLEDCTRRLIGRQEKGDIVVKKLKNALEKGFVVSVDIIYGLPGQTLKQLLATLEQLTAIGVHGLSLYQLQISYRNRPFLKRQGVGKQDPLLNYVLFQAAEHYLRRKGYRKNFFTHFALPQDKNLYCRHAKRGEDLLAMGPAADGVFRNYVYRHPNYKNYVGSPAPVLQGGMMESPVEQKTRPTIASLMAASIARSMLQELDADPLLDLWLSCDMLEQTLKSEVFGLTANGSWFIMNMLAQLQERVSAVMGTHNLR